MSVIPLSNIIRGLDIISKNIVGIPSGLAKEVTSGSYSFSAANTTETIVSVTIPQIKTKRILQGFYRIKIDASTTSAGLVISFTITFKYKDGSTESKSYSFDGTTLGVTSKSWDLIFPRVDVVEITITGSAGDTSTTVKYSIYLYLVHVIASTYTIGANSSTTIFDNSVNKNNLLCIINVVNGNSNVKINVNCNGYQYSIDAISGVYAFISDGNLTVSLQNSTTASQNITLIMFVMIIDENDIIVAL